MKTICFKNLEEGDLKYYTQRGNREVLSVSIDQSKLICIYRSKMRPKEVRQVPEEDEIQLSPSEALYELDILIENIKNITGYKNLQRELLEHSDPQPTV